jgi:uncharacterized membrane protein
MPFALQIPSDDLVAAATSAALLAGYHLFMRHRSTQDPTYTVQSRFARVRAKWVEGVLRQNKDILAVQTLRNSTMAATFLASTSVVLVMGILNLVAKGDALGSKSAPKLVLMLLDLFIAFFQFAMSIRLYNHVGYMLGMPGATEQGGLAPHEVATHLNRAADFYSAGMRAYYFLVPLVFWFFGAWALLVATAALLVLLFANDRAPSAAARPGEPRAGA